MHGITLPPGGEPWQEALRQRLESLVGSGQTESIDVADTISTIFSEENIEYNEEGFYAPGSVASSCIEIIAAAWYALQAVAPPTNVGADQIKGLWRNNKTGDLYWTRSIGIGATNFLPRFDVVVYHPVIAEGEVSFVDTSQTFQRYVPEFFEKFHRDEHAVLVTPTVVEEPADLEGSAIILKEGSKFYQMLLKEVEKLKEEPDAAI